MPLLNQTKQTSLLQTGNLSKLASFKPTLAKMITLSWKSKQTVTLNPHLSQN